MVVLAAATTLSATALADDYKTGMVMVKDPRARVTLQSLPAGGFFTMTMPVL